jgi:PhnB protein
MVTIKTTTHLNFRGDARAALGFYKSVFGGEQAVVSYRDADAVQNPDEADQVMWGQVAATNGFRIMAYDVPSRLGWNPGEIPVFVSVRGSDTDESPATGRSSAPTPPSSSRWRPPAGRRSMAC